MRRLRAALIRVANLLRQGRLERELAAEMEGHLQLHIDDNLKTGMTPVEARQASSAAARAGERAVSRRRGLPRSRVSAGVRFGAHVRSAAFTLSACRC